MNKKTLVIGASEHVDRYSHQAVKLLQQFGHDVVAVGVKEGQIGQVPIQVGLPEDDAYDTVTMYLNPNRQRDLESDILNLHPKRIIFNPGAENYSLAQKAKQQGIEVEEACTLVMLRTGQY